MNQRTDIVEDIFYRIKKILGEKFNGEIEVQLKIEEEIVRQSWAGERPYIASFKNKRQKTNDDALMFLNKGDPPALVVERTRLSRSTVYRLMHKK